MQSQINTVPSLGSIYGIREWPSDQRLRLRRQEAGIVLKANKHDEATWNRRTIYCKSILHT